jgi:hypothetical protein
MLGLGTWPEVAAYAKQWNGMKGGDIIRKEGQVLLTDKQAATTAAAINELTKTVKETPPYNKEPLKSKMAAQIKNLKAIVASNNRALATARSEIAAQLEATFYTDLYPGGQVHIGDRPSSDAIIARYKNTAAYKALQKKYLRGGY